jgi:hypothetical protein
MRPTVEALAAITVDDLARWQGNLSKLSHAVYIYTTEGDELASALKELVDVNQRG